MIVGFLTLFLRGQVIVLVSSNYDLHIPSFTFKKLQYLCMKDICNLNCHLVLVSMPEPIFPHQVDIGEMWPCWVLDLNGWIHWNSFHVMKKKFGCARISATYFMSIFLFESWYNNHNLLLVQINNNIFTYDPSFTMCVHNPIETI